MQLPAPSAYSLVHEPAAAALLTCAVLCHNFSPDRDSAHDDVIQPLPSTNDIGIMVNYAAPCTPGQQQLQLKLVLDHDCK